MVHCEGSCWCLLKRDLALQLEGVTDQIRSFRRVVYIYSTQRALPNRERSPHFTGGETKARGSSLTQRPNSRCSFQHATLWATYCSRGGDGVGSSNVLESGGACVPSALCFCGSSAGSLHQLNVCDVQLSALTKILRKDGCKQSIREERMKFSRSRTGRESWHLGEAQGGRE